FNSPVYAILYNIASPVDITQPNASFIEPSGASKIYIAYDGVNAPTCTYEFVAPNNTSVPQNEDGARVVTQSCAQALDGKTALTHYNLGLDRGIAYVLELDKLCRVDDSGDGKNCTSRWKNQIQSYQMALSPDDLVGSSSGVSLPPSSETSTTTIFLGLAPAVYNLYNWALGVGALLALAIIIYGGLLYSASAGNPSRIEEAKKWITSALFGLALLFSTVIILNVVNPRLTTLQDIETTINPEIKVGFSIIGGGGGVPEQIYEPLDRLPSCKEECEAAIEGGEAVFSCDGLPLCRDALPPDCTSTYCLLTSFSKYAKSLTTRQEIPGVQSPTSPAHVKYVNTLPFGTKSKGHCYGAECGVYVATVIRNTIDPDFPTYGTWNIWPYLEGNDKYEKVEIKSSADLRTGDILMPSDYRSVHETGNLEVTDEDHGHIALWIEGDTYEAALGSEPDLCGTGYLPRGPRSGTKGSSWSSIMDTAFRYKYFNRSNTPGGPNPFIPG
ncbi:MAG: pilin, partial [bacterium]|nr:pilin [bacterium]